MGMTMTQKILAAHAGLDHVEAGQLIEAKLDVVMANDITGPMALPIFRQMAENVFDKEALVQDAVICNNQPPFGLPTDSNNKVPRPQPTLFLTAPANAAGAIIDTMSNTKKAFFIYTPPNKILFIYSNIDIIICQLYLPFLLHPHFFETIIKNTNL